MALRPHRGKEEELPREREREIDGAGLAEKEGGSLLDNRQARPHSHKRFLRVSFSTASIRLSSPSFSLSFSSFFCLSLAASAILGVDFFVFPRSLAKTCLYGLSLVRTRGLISLLARLVPTLSVRMYRASVWTFAFLHLSISSLSFTRLFCFSLLLKNASNNRHLLFLSFFEVPRDRRKNENEPSLDDNSV